MIRTRLRKSEPAVVRERPTAESRRARWHRIPARTLLSRAARRLGFLKQKENINMNIFDFDHPMYVHLVAEPKSSGVPSPAALRRVYPASADLATNKAREVVESEPYPEPSWSISEDTLAAMRREAPVFKLFIEIGTFIGQGVLAIQGYFAANGVRCPVVTADTYTGTLLIGTDVHEKKHGFIRYFDRSVLATFFTKRGLGETTFPVQASSRDFFRKFYYLGLRASHIYLDASHEYLDTYEEMRLAWECLEEGGVLAGDDYNWTTVKAAVDRFCLERRVAYQISPGRTNGGVSALQWVIGAKNSRSRHDDPLHDKIAVP
jgi:hypothetical protein